MVQIFMVVTLLVLAAAFSPAQAQNRGRHTSTQYSGPYLGLTAGHGWSDVNVKFTTGGVTTGDTASVDGWEGGPLAGYGFQFPQSFGDVWNGYVGFEISYEWSAADGDALGASVEKDGVLNISMRPGFTWADTLLGYGVIGYSRARFKAGSADNGVDGWADGFALGLGTEVGKWGRLKGRLEYVHSWYEDQDYSTADGVVSADTGADVVKVGLIYRF